MFDNTSFWAKNGTVAPEEIAAHVHHGLVFTHPYPNGNGRGSRLMADLWLAHMGSPRFTLGNITLRSPGET